MYSLWQNCQFVKKYVCSFYSFDHNGIICIQNLYYSISDEKTRSTSDPSSRPSAAWSKLHRALCSLFQPDTDGTRVSKCRQLSHETRGLDPMLFQYWSRAVSRGANIETTLGQILVFAGLHTGVCLHPTLPSIIFSPADQDTFSKTAGQSHAYYNT